MIDILIQGMKKSVEFWSNFAKIQSAYKSKHEIKLLPLTFVWIYAIGILSFHSPIFLLKFASS